MEKEYWLGRKRASLKLARTAASSEARLAYYDLAGRYSLKALTAGMAVSDGGNLLSALLPPGSGELHATTEGVR